MGPLIIFSSNHLFLHTRRSSEKLENGGVLTNSNAEGIQEVIDGGGDYVLLLESPSAEYEVSKNCGLTLWEGCSIPMDTELP